MGQVIFPYSKKKPVRQAQGKYTQGQTLIEALVALGVIAVIMSAIVIAVVSALRNAQYSKNQNLAQQYAQQGMELMRQARDADWGTFSSYATASVTQYCLDKGSTVLHTRDLSVPHGCSYGGRSPQNIDVFARQVDFTSGTAECGSGNLRVAVSVSWSDGVCNTSNVFCHKVQLVSCFSSTYSALPKP